MFATATSVDVMQGAKPKGHAFRNRRELARRQATQRPRRSRSPNAGTPRREDSETHPLAAVYVCGCVRLPWRVVTGAYLSRVAKNACAAFGGGTCPARICWNGIMR